MPDATVGLISQIWVGKLPMKWMLGVSKMLAGAVITKVIYPRLAFIEQSFPLFLR